MVLKFLEVGKSNEAFPRHMRTHILIQNRGYNFRGLIVRDILRSLHELQVKNICFGGLLATLIFRALHPKPHLTLKDSHWAL